METKNLWSISDRPEESITGQFCSYSVKLYLVLFSLIKLSYEILFKITSLSLLQTRATPKNSHYASAAALQSLDSNSPGLALVTATM